MNFGSRLNPIINAKNPAIKVDVQASPIVNNKVLPDLFPKEATPGTINPIIISGIIKDKKFPNKPLNVVNILIGNTIERDLQISPTLTPSIKAIIILLISENFFICSSPFNYVFM